MSPKETFVFSQAPVSHPEPRLAQEEQRAMIAYRAMVELQGQ